MTDTKKRINDFGFNLVTAEDLFKQKRLEVAREARERLKENYEKRLQLLKNRIDNLYNAVVPLIEELSQETNRDYVHWPERGKEMKELLETINKIARKNKKKS